MKPIHHFLLLVVLALASCAPQAIPRAIVPTLPARTASVLPVVESARQAQARTAVVSDRLERQVESLKQTATQVSDGMAEAVLEADRLRKQQGASEAELDGLWQRLTAVKERNLFLETQADEAVAFALEQKSLREVSETTLAEVQRLATASEAEKTALQLVAGDQARTITEQAAAYDRQAKALVSAQRGAAVGTFLKWCLAGVVALIVAYILLRTYLPTLRLP